MFRVWCLVGSQFSSLSDHPNPCKRAGGDLVHGLRLMGPMASQLGFWD